MAAEGVYQDLKLRERLIVHSSAEDTPKPGVFSHFSPVPSTRETA